MWGFVFFYCFMTLKIDSFISNKWDKFPEEYSQGSCTKCMYERFLD